MWNFQKGAFFTVTGGDTKAPFKLVNVNILGLVPFFKISWLDWNDVEPAADATLVATGKLGGGTFGIEQSWWQYCKTFFLLGVGAIKSFMFFSCNWVQIKLTHLIPVQYWFIKTQIVELIQAGGGMMPWELNIN